MRLVLPGSKIGTYCVALLYAILVGATVHRHEPWADEAQSWLLARDASLVDLWTKLLHYEGTPGLWHTLLHVLIRIGLPYSGLNIISGLLGLAAVWLLLRYAPFPFWVRALVPFTFFLCYQYAVIARSYSLLPILMFACAMAYKRAGAHPWRFTLLLCLLAAVSVHGFVLSIAIGIAACASGWVSWHNPDRSDYKTMLAAAACYLAVLSLLAFSAWPASDVAFPLQHGYSIRHLYEAVILTVREPFTGFWIPSLIVIALSVRFLWRGGGMLVFAIAMSALCAVAWLIYAQVWHEGVVVLVWLFAIWVSAYSTTFDLGVKCALIIVILFQGYWTIASVKYDWNRAYSGGSAVAGCIHAPGLEKDRIDGAGFACVAIQPYFPRNIFANFNSGKVSAFWDWSKRNHANDPDMLFGSESPDYFLAGYKKTSERTRWAGLAHLAGYEGIRHFEGKLFWRTGIMESESFDLYRRGPRARTALAALVSMMDASTARQLLSGFYGIEGSWRWTAHKFSIALGVPQVATERTTRLTIHLFVPDVQIQMLGPITLRASVDGHELGSMLLPKPGSYVYSRDIPAGVLCCGSVPVDVTLDKAMLPSARDARELGVIVSAIGLETN